MGQPFILKWRSPNVPNFWTYLLLHCALANGAVIVTGHVCVFCVFVCGGPAVPEPYYSQRAQCICVSLSVFFIVFMF